MAARKKLKEQTLEEFKAWIEGIEVFQGASWVPTKEQWNNIRKQIDLIVVPEPEPAPPPPPQQGTFAAPGIAMAPAMSAPMAQPENPGFVQPPPVPSSIPPVPPEASMSEAAKELLTTGKTPTTESGGPSSFE